MKLTVQPEQNEQGSNDVPISGAKNSALKVLVASLLTPEPVHLDNLPLALSDVQTKVSMLTSAGATVTRTGPSGVRVESATLAKDCTIPLHLGTIRTSLLLLGALAHRCHTVRVPHPAGCRIGDRSFDLHLSALDSLGIECRSDGDYLVAAARRLRPADIRFPIRTTGGTENAILASCLIPGTTRIYNAHTRPEVLDLVRCLNSMGARIAVLGSGRINIEGVPGLSGCRHSIIYDSVEALTYIALASVLKRKLRIRNLPAEDMEIPLIYMRECGLRFEHRNNDVLVDGTHPLTPVELSTGPYPGINSDFQPLFTVMASQADGQSRITDIRFRSRFQYVDELVAMGARIRREENILYIDGPAPLHGTSVTANDLRGAAAMLVAATAANGATTINNAEQIFRGYERIEEKLNRLGIHIKREPIPAPAVVGEDNLDAPNEE